ncbi:MAG: YciI family protein [Chitinophagaceae bacterium]
MQQYIVHAWDGTDDKALERRMASRNAHFENARKMKAAGSLILGGAMLNKEGKMIGSTMVVQFEKPEELQHWLSIEPYIVGNVWERFEVHPFRAADIEKYFAEMK